MLAALPVLVVTRRVEKTCSTELVQKEQGVFAPLPLDKPVTVTLEAPKDGQLKFSCAHGHIAGNVVVQQPFGTGAARALP